MLPNKLRVLLVEDNPADARLIQELLVGLGGAPIDVVAVNRLAAASACLAEGGIDVVLLDLGLPDSEDLPTFSRLQADAPATPIVILAGLDDEAMAFKAVREGAQDYLVKGQVDGHLLGRALRYAIERKRAEESLAASEAFQRAIFETEPECVTLLDAAGLILRMNRAGLAMVEADSLEQVVGRSAYEIVAPEHREAFRALTDDVFRGGSGRLEFETVGLRATRRWLETHAVPLRDPRGEIVALLGVTRDVTEQRRLEGELRQAQKMEAIGQLAAGIAHDFNNLLTVIQGRSQLGLSRLRPGDPLAQDLDIIQKTAARAAALTRQLLTFSRKKLRQPKVVDLNSVLAGLSTMLSRLIREDIELVVVPGADLGRVHADPGQLEQVIINLAVNASDAMPNGGVLTLETASGELDQGYAAPRLTVAPGRYVVLVVSDTGVGMTREVQAHLFEPFFTTKAPDKGTGLGLATVYGIVKQSGGHLAVYSEPGHGTTFRIYLPRVEGLAETGERQPSAEAPGGSETVLLVEDEPDLRDLGRDILRERGYTVLEAVNGEEAIRIAEQHAGPIALLLTDVVMPQMGGRDLARRLAAARPSIKVLYMSGYLEHAILHHGVMDDDSPLLQKPFTPDSLARKVREVLEG